MEDSFLFRIHKKAPLNFAHRGASNHAPENTLAAFEQAVQHGADGIELDVRLCRTNEWVVFHDSRLNRTTNGRGYVRAKSLEEIRRLDAGVQFGWYFHRQVVPTLAEVLDLARGRLLLNIEIKSMSAVSERDLAQLLELVYRHHAQQRSILSSFNPLVLRRLARLDARMPLGLLLTPNLLGRSLAPQLRRLTGMHALHLHARAVNLRRVTQVQEMGLFLLVWGANTPASLHRMVDLGVDGIITDEPLELSRILARRKP